ncbi:MAG: hypothetical protein HYV47_01555 [Candidatus Nealsonbacteria bacterium]|nr:hypothetical protein [Candidatus Nealsonbacteria bacterium]
MEWLIRSSKEKKELEIFAVGGKDKKLVAKILDDFVLQKPEVLPKKAQIQNLNGKTLGFIEAFYPEKDEITILSSRGNLISQLQKGNNHLKVRARLKMGFVSGAVKKEKFEIIPLAQAVFKENLGAGIQQIYSFGKEKIYYFEKDDEIAITVRGGARFLKFLPLLLAQRVWRQEEIKKLLS